MRGFFKRQRPDVEPFGITVDHAPRREDVRKLEEGLDGHAVAQAGVAPPKDVAIYVRDEDGHIVGLPAKISLEGLHEYLEGSPWLTGELNIEGMAVHGRYGLPCPDCGARVQRILYADNEANYCARCQTGGRLLADRALSRLLKQDWPRTLEV